MISAAGSASSTASLFNNPLKGIQRGVQQASTASAKIAAGDVSPENMVSVMEGQIMVKANSVVAKNVDQTLGSFLDALA